MSDIITSIFTSELAERLINRFVVLFLFVSPFLLLFLCLYVPTLTKTRRRKKKLKGYGYRPDGAANIGSAQKQREEARVEKGKEGERRLLSSLFRARRNEDFVLYNLYVPLGNGETTEIDSVFISRYGIFVYECKNYYGAIDGLADNKRWVQEPTLFGPEKEKRWFYNPIMQNDTHIRALRQFLANSKKQIPPIRGYVSFPKELEIGYSARVALGEMLVTHDDAGSRLQSDIKLRFGKEVLSDKDIFLLAKFLRENCCNVDESVKQQHIQYVKSKCHQA